MESSSSPNNFDEPFSWLESLPVCMALLDSEQRCEFANRKFEQWVGHPHEDLAGHLLSEILNQELYPKVRPAVESALAGHETSLELPSPVSKEAEPSTISLIPRHNASGAVLGFLWYEDLHRREEYARKAEENHQRFLISIEAMLDCFVIYAAIRNEAGAIVDFRVVLANQAACRYMSLPREQFLGRRMLEILPGISETEIFDEFSRVVETGVPYVRDALEYEGVIAGKAYRGIYEIRTVKMDDGLAVTWRDIKERKRIEMALLQEHNKLRRERSRMRAVLDALPVGVVIADASGAITESNQAARDIWGRPTLGTGAAEPPHECIAWRSDTGEAIQHDDSPLVRALTQGEITAGLEVDVELLGGRRKTLLVYCHPVRDMGGNITGGVCVNVDVSEQKRILEELKHTNQQIVTLLESITDGFVSIDSNWHCTYVNNAGAALVNKRPEELIGRHVWTTFSDLVSTPVYSHLQKAMWERIPVQFEVYDPSSRAWYESRCYPSTDGGLSVFFTNTTDRKNMEKQLRDLNRTLESRVRERTESLLLSQERLRALSSQLTLAEQQERRRIAEELHDYLAQMLVVSKMRVDMLARNPRPELLEKGLQELSAILNESLQYTRNLIAQISPRTLYESGLVSAVHWLASQMKQHGLEVTVGVEGNVKVPKSEKAVLIFQTVRELLFNILKHARVNRASVHLSGELSDSLTVSIADSGVGFDPSQDLSSAAAGSHFGLFSIRERIEALGGSMRIDSAPGQGTRVHFTIPVQPSDEEPPPDKSPAVSIPVKTAPLPRSKEKELRVLIADDHDLVRQGLRHIIEACEGIRVVGEARNGEEAVQLAHETRCDVVVMDVNMPGMNGIEAARHIKQTLPGTIIIGMSVHAEQDMELAMRSVGASHYFTKGESSDSLCRLLLTLSQFQK